MSKAVTITLVKQPRGYIVAKATNTTEFNVGDPHGLDDRQVTILYRRDDVEVTIWADYFYQRRYLRDRTGRTD
jgi:hypothetical protein